MSKHSSDTSRREFLKTGAAAATGVLAGARPGLARSSDKPSAAKSRVLGANDRITVGFIGLGWQGFDGHLVTIRDHGLELNVAAGAVCEPWTVRLERARAALELPAASAYTDYGRVLDRPDIDAVFIATPEHWHARIAREAIDAGKHVYCEKPLTRYLGEAFDLHDTVVNSDRVFQLGSQYCSEGKWHKAAELITGGRIGAPVLAQASYMRNVPDGEWNYEIDLDLTPETLDWKLWVGHIPDRPFSPDDYFRWKKYHPYTAGILSNLLTHRIVPLLMATGSPEFPSRVACLGTKYITPDRDIPDNTQVIAEFPSGFSIIVIGSTVNEVGLAQVIRGHEGTLYFGGNSVELRPERPFADLVDPELHENIEPSVSVLNHVHNWVDVIRNGGAPTGNIDLAIKAHTVVCLAEMSHRMGEMLHFSPETRAVTTGSGETVEPLSYKHTG